MDLPSKGTTNTPTRNARWFINTFFHQLILVVCVYIIWTLASSPDSVDFWHGMLCTLGFLPFMAEGILLFSGDTPWAMGLQRKTKMWLHGIFLSMGSVFCLSGIIVMFADRLRRNKDHFDNAHAICGLISLIFALVAIIGGLLIANIKKVKDFMSPVWLKICHVCISQFSFLLGIVALCLILDHDPLDVLMSSSQRTLTIITLSFICIYTLINPAISLFKKLVRAF